MSKFFVPRENIGGESIIIRGGDAAHISRVLRMTTGDGLTLCDGRGIDYETVIDKISPDEVECKIISEKKSSSEPNISVTLVQGLPKASKMDYIIQKTTELGISRIIPCSLARCVVKLENKKAEEKKTERWRKIAAEAAKQSGRGIIPEVTMPKTLDAVLDELKAFDIVFVPYECERENTLKSVLTSCENPKNAAFIIGPEGGFDIAETEKIRAAGIKTVTLGRRILRTETAGEAVLSMLMYEIGDINRISEK